MQKHKYYVQKQIFRKDRWCFSDTMMNETTTMMYISCIYFPGFSEMNCLIPFPFLEEISDHDFFSLTFSFCVDEHIYVS